MMVEKKVVVGIEGLKEKSKEENGQKEIDDFLNSSKLIMALCKKNDVIIYKYIYNEKRKKLYQFKEFVPNNNISLISEDVIIFNNTYYSLVENDKEIVAYIDSNK